jgi:hypothetical protein
MEDGHMATLKRREWFLDFSNLKDGVVELGADRESIERADRLHARLDIAQVNHFS